MVWTRNCLPAGSNGNREPLQEAASVAHRKTTKRSKPRSMLRLADLEQLRNAVLHSASPCAKDEGETAPISWRASRSSRNRHGLWAARDAVVAIIYYYAHQNISWRHRFF